jgi:hypothetical protein
MEKEADNGFAIQVAVVNDAIVVTMPGTTRRPKKARRRGAR